MCALASRIFSRYFILVLNQQKFDLKIHSAVCCTAGPQPFPKPVLHTVRSSVSSFSFHHTVISLRSSSSCIRLLPRVHVTSTLPSIFPSRTCFSRQLLRKVWPIQSAFLLFNVCTIYFSSFAVYNTSFFTRSGQLISSILLQHHIAKIPRYFRFSLWSVRFSTKFQT